MKATYTNPPFQSPQIGQLEEAFLRAAIRHAGGEDRLKALIADNDFQMSKTLSTVKSAAKISMLFQTGAMSEHNNAYFHLEV